MTTLDSRPRLGGPLAIDLVNTERQVSGAIVDWFELDGAVEAFASEHGHSVAPGDARRMRESLVATRQLVRRVLATASKPPSAELLYDISEALRPATVNAVNSSDGVDLVVSGDSPHHALSIEALVSAIELVRDRANRVRSCEHPKCVLWFVDTSKGGRRRWCSMDTCGNRAKAQRHYQRSTGADS